MPRHALACALHIAPHETPTLVLRPDTPKSLTSRILGHTLRPQSAIATRQHTQRSHKRCAPTHHDRLAADATPWFGNTDAHFANAPSNPHTTQRPSPQTPDTKETSSHPGASGHAQHHNQPNTPTMHISIPTRHDAPRTLCRRPFDCTTTPAPDSHPLHGTTVFLFVAACASTSPGPAHPADGALRASTSGGSSRGPRCRCGCHCTESAINFFIWLSDLEQATCISIPTRLVWSGSMGFLSFIRSQSGWSLTSSKCTLTSVVASLKGSACGVGLGAVGVSARPGGGEIRVPGGVARVADRAPRFGCTHDRAFFDQSLE